MERKDDHRTYVFTSRRQHAAGPFDLTGYRDIGRAWRKYRRREIDVLLISADDLVQLSGQLTRDSDQVWGVEQGTQHIALVPSRALHGALESQHWRALSLSIQRTGLATVFKPGAYRVAGNPLAVILGREPGKKSAGFRWNPREARKIWIANPPRDLHFRIVTLDHPLLVSVARRIAEQWQKTLNLSVSWEALSSEQFEMARLGDGQALFLTVLDLDDGSLQNLWLDALGGMSGGDSPTVSARSIDHEFATRMMAHHPYLPLLVNQHLYLARGVDGADAIRRICPACDVPANPAPVRISK